MRTLENEILILEENEVNTPEGKTQTALHTTVLVKRKEGHLDLLKSRNVCESKEFQQPEKPSSSNSCGSVVLGDYFACRSNDPVKMAKMILALSDEL